MAQIPQDVGRPNDPNYLNFSGGPVAQPKPNLAAGTALEGIGTVTNLAAKGINALVTDSIEKGLRKDLEAERTAYTHELDQTKQLLLGGRPLNLLPPETDEGGTTFSADMEHLTTTLKRLKSAKESNPRVSSADVNARYNTIVSHYRNLYRGHVDQIDKITTGVLGYDPANALVRNQVADINRLLTSANSGKNKTETMFNQAIM